MPARHRTLITFSSFGAQNHSLNLKAIRPEACRYGDLKGEKPNLEGPHNPSSSVLQSLN